jgi:histidine triad (HIT) family protein
MDGCIFCKIAAGEIPSATVYEDEDLRVIADISPANLGHLLIIPKEHAADLTELPAETACKVMLTAKRVVAAMKKGLCPDGVNVLQNNGEAAGQTVMHYHMHIIPRYRGDQVKIGWGPMQGQPEAVAGAAEKVKKALEETDERP